MARIIPDMEKMPKSLNPFLEPLVDEFQAFWNPGIRLHTSKSMIPRNYRAAILCAAADLPAVRKLSGLKGHTQEAAQSVSSIFQVQSREVLTVLDLIERIGHQKVTAPNADMRRKLEKLVMQCSMTNFQQSMAHTMLYY